MPDLNDLANFHAVVTQGSFTAAARHLGVPKATVSKRVARLEADLAVRLLERSTRSLRLTQVGAAIFEHSETIVAGLEAAQAVAQNAHAEPNGLVRISCPQGLLPNLVEGMLRRFMHAYPKVRLEILELNRPVDLIAEGVDLALRVRTAMSDDLSLVVRRLGISRRVLVASPALAAQCSADMTIDDLARSPILALTDERESWTLVSTDGATRTVPIKPRLLCSDFFVLSQAVMDGLGIAMLPDHLCQHKLEAGTLVRVLPQWQSGEGVIHAVFPSRRGLPSALRALIDFLATEFAGRERDLSARSAIDATSSAALSWGR
jgi:DNA-binding transcriptional LysR family regulator